MTMKINLILSDDDYRRTLYRLMQFISHRYEGEPVFIEIE